MKFQNRSSCSKGPIMRAGKVCGDFQDLKSPGTDGDHFLTREGPEKVGSFIPNPNIGHRNWARMNTSLRCSKFA